MAKQQGLTEEQIAELGRHSGEMFTSRELTAIALAETLFEDPHDVSPELSESLRREFSDGELVELMWAIGMFIGLGKMVAFLGIERATP